MKIEEALSVCLEEVRSGKASVEQCLERYPSLRHELEPLLRLALSIERPAEVAMAPADRASMRARLMAQITQRATPARRPLSWPAWVRPAVTVPVGILLALVFLAGGTAYAAQSSLPGDALYAVKTATEETRLFLTRGDAARLELEMDFADRRLSELGRLPSADDARASVAVRGYLTALDGALAVIEKDQSQRYQLAEKAAARLRQQISACDALTGDGASPSSPPTQASTASVRAFVRTLEIIASRTPVDAAQTAAEAMRGRLEHARTNAAAGNYDGMDLALRQYEELNGFGQWLLSRTPVPQNEYRELQALELQAANGNLASLNTLASQVPLQYRGGIESSIELTEQTRTQARYGQPGQGGPEAAGGEQSPGQGGPTETPGGADQVPEDSGNGTGAATPGATSSPGSPGPANGGHGPGDGTGSGSGGNQSPAGPASPTGGSGPAS